MFRHKLKAIRDFPECSWLFGMCMVFQQICVTWSRSFSVAIRVALGRHFQHFVDARVAPEGTNRQSCEVVTAVRTSTVEACVMSFNYFSQ